MVIHARQRGWRSYGERMRRGNSSSGGPQFDGQGPLECEAVSSTSSSIPNRNENHPRNHQQREEREEQAACGKGERKEADDEEEALENEQAHAKNQREILRPLERHKVSVNYLFAQQQQLEEQLECQMDHQQHSQTCHFTISFINNQDNSGNHFESKFVGTARRIGLDRFFLEQVLSVPVTMPITAGRVVLTCESQGLQQQHNGNLRTQCQAEFDLSNASLNASVIAGSRSFVGGRLSFQRQNLQDQWQLRQVIYEFTTASFTSHATSRPGSPSTHTTVSEIEATTTEDEEEEEEEGEEDRPYVRTCASSTCMSLSSAASSPSTLSRTLSSSLSHVSTDDNQCSEEVTYQQQHIMSGSSFPHVMPHPHHHPHHLHVNGMAQPPHLAPHQIPYFPGAASGLHPSPPHPSSMSSLQFHTVMPMPLAMHPHHLHMAYATQAGLDPVVVAMANAVGQGYPMSPTMIPGGYDTSVSFVQDGNPYIRQMEMAVPRELTLLDALKAASQEGDWVRLRLMEELKAVTRAAKEQDAFVIEAGVEFVAWIMSTLRGALAVILADRATNKIVVELARCCTAEQQDELLDLLEISLPALLHNSIAINALKNLSAALCPQARNSLLRMCIACTPLEVLNSGKCIGLIVQLASDVDETFVMTLLREELLSSPDRLAWHVCNKYSYTLVVDAIKRERQGKSFALWLASQLSSNKLMHLVCYNQYGCLVVRALVSRLEDLDADSSFFHGLQSVGIVNLINHVPANEIVREMLDCHNLVAPVSDQVFALAGPRPDSQFLGMLQDPVASGVLIKCLEKDTREEVVAERKRHLARYVPGLAI